MVNAKPLTLSVAQPESAVSESARRRRLSIRYGWLAFRAILLVPALPLMGYWLLDQTGFSQWLIATGIMPAAILGEGFGHVGLCFSIHYLFTALRFGWKALALVAR